MTPTPNILVASTGKHVLAAYTGNVTGHNINYNDYYGGSATPFEWNGADYDFANYKTAATQDGNSANSDPKVTNPGSGDFTLQSGSPAIDAGANLGATYQWALAPSSSWLSSISTFNQNSYGFGWEIGAFVFVQQ